MMKMCRKNKMTPLGLLISSLLMYSTFAPAAPVNDSDHVTVSSLAALQNAINQAPASGRVITLKSGTYHQSEEIRVNARDHITIQGETSNYNDTVIKGPGINNHGLDINIKVENSDYVTIKNMTIEDSYYHGIQVKNGSSHFLADHLKTWDNGESGFKIAGPVYGSDQTPSDYGTIENSLIGFSTAGQRGVVEGIDIVGAVGWRIHGNTFTHILRAGGSHIAYAAFAKGNSKDTIMEDNIVKDSFIGLSFGGGGTGARYFRDGDTTFEHRGGIIRNNIIYNMRDAGIYLNKSHDFKVYNNTIFNVGAGTGAVESRFPESSGQVRNNLTNAPIKRRDGGSAVTSNNIVEATNRTFMDPAGGNYHLASSAVAAIDHGQDLSADVADDIDGQPRPLGTAYDIGADEYAGKHVIKYEAEHSVHRLSGGRRSTYSIADASDGVYDVYYHDRPGDAITYRLNVPDPGVYGVKARVRQATTRGRFQLSIGGVNQGAVQDLYAQGSDFVTLDFGTKVFNTRGTKSFTFTVTGKNPESTDYKAGLDFIELIASGSGKKAITYEAEKLPRSLSGGRRSTYSIGQASAGVYDVYYHDRPGDSIAYHVNVPDSGVYDVKVRVRQATTRGQFQLSIGGVNQGAVRDLYSAGSDFVTLDFGRKTFSTPGVKVFKFTVTGKNAKSTDYKAGLDFIRLTAD